MRFSFYTVLALQAALESQAVSLQQSGLLGDSLASYMPDNNFAQVDAFATAETGNANLVEALGKVINTLNTGHSAGAASHSQVAKEDDNDEDDEAPAKKKLVKKKPGKNAGTNIAITTATDQHINIFVPEDPKGKVTVKKTEGVHIVESDSDAADPNKEVKKALGDKIRGELVKQVMTGGADDDGDDDGDDDDDDDDSEVDSSDSGKEKIKKAAKKIKEAKGKKKKTKKALEKASKKKSKKDELAQVGSVALTEQDMLELAEMEHKAPAASEVLDSLFAQNQDSDWENDGNYLAEVSSCSGSATESESESEGESLSMSESEDDLLAQTGATAEKPTVEMVPQVHVQVTRVGYNNDD